MGEADVFTTTYTLICTLTVHFVKDLTVATVNSSESFAKVLALIYPCHRLKIEPPLVLVLEMQSKAATEHVCHGHYAHAESKQGTFSFVFFKIFLAFSEKECK